MIAKSFRSRTAVSCALGSCLLSMMTNAGFAGVLEEVKARGVLRCGVAPNAPGFAAQDAQGKFRGFDVDFCRAIAAAVLGDANKIELTPLGLREAFATLTAGSVDVLTHRFTWTFNRDNGAGIETVLPVFFDGQGFIVRKSAGIKNLNELNGATICVTQGSTTELNLADYFRSHKLTYQLATFADLDETRNAYDAGRCDAWTNDRGGLAARSLGLKNRADNVMLPETISKEPIGPMVKTGDPAWFHVVRWTASVPIAGEELSVTAENVDDQRKTGTNPEVKRLLGVGDDLGQKIGLSQDWSYNIIKQVGNYGEIFERNVGANSPLGLTRGLECAVVERRVAHIASVPVSSILSDTTLACVTPVHRGWRQPLAALLRGGTRGLAIQLAVLIGVALVIAMLAANVVANLQRLGVKTGFGFLERPAGFDISQTLISYGEHATYLTAFVVALLNTLLVFALAGLLATVLGFLIGIGRLSRNGIVAAAAGFYVETFRNIPVLIQLLFWYFAVLRPLPGPRQSLKLGDIAFLNNRGLFLPSLHFGDGSELLIAAAAGALLVMVAVLLAARHRRIQSGKRPAWAWCAVLPIVGLFVLLQLAPAGAITWQVPRLTGFNFSGGVAVTPELFALTLGLAIYSAAYIAEIVRSGVQAIPRGQIEAARSLGLSPWQIVRLIEVPLALRIIVAPLGAYYVILLKNTSLGSAIAYPDLMHVFAGTVLNQTGQPLDVMLITLATYLGLGLVLSGMTSAVNRWLSR